MISNTMGNLKDKAEAATSNQEAVTQEQPALEQTGPLIAAGVN